MRRFSILVALATVVALAGCGATDWKSAQVSSAPATVAPGRATAKATAQANARAAAEDAAERPLVDAMVASADAQPDRDPSITQAVLACTARAFVHGYGAAAFTSAGITPNELRDPNSNLDALPDPTDAQIDAIGGALQQCRYSDLMAAPLALQLRTPDAPTVACLQSGLRTPAARRFLVLSGLDRHPDLLAAHNLVGLIAACVDLPTYILRVGNVVVDAETRACMLDELKGSEAAFKDYVALEIAGTDPETEQTSFETVTTSLNRCRPSARTGFTVPSG